MNDKVVLDKEGFDATTLHMKQVFLKECEQKHQQLNNDVEEYKTKIKSYQNVSSKLKEMIKKLEVPTTAPICAVGYFCDAHLIRTNEVLVDLGADYLAECSSFSAQKIINRRVQEYQKTISEGMESLKRIEETIKHTKSLFDEKDKDVVEICEPFDENAEKEFYEKRQQRKSKVTLDVDKEALEHEKAMSRLDELYKLEKNNEEMSELESTVSGIESKCEDDDDEEVEEEEDEEETAKENINKMLQMPGVSEKDMARLLEYLEDCDLTSDEENETDDENEIQSEDLDSDDYENVSTPSPGSVDNLSPSVDKTVVSLQAVKIEEIKDIKLEKEEVHTIEKVAAKNEENAAIKPKKKKKVGVRFARELEKVKLFNKTDEININDKNLDSGVENETKSILRSNEPTPVDRDALLNDHKEVVSMSSNCFPGEIVEKNTITVLECQPSTSKDPNPEFIPKVSRFRSAQKQRKSGGGA